MASNKTLKKWSMGYYIKLSYVIYVLMFISYQYFSFVVVPRKLAGREDREDREAPIVPTGDTTLHL